MASEQQVKSYLAYWFQLGKKVVLSNGDLAILPKPVMIGSRYSDEFERIWQLILSPESGDCYLESTNETIAQLLTPGWEIDPCARCEMPIPLKSLGLPPEVCPCCDLPTWPNTELPIPRNGVCSQRSLSGICDRLQKLRIQESEATIQESQITSQDSTEDMKRFV
jgi:hypothetical protein